MYYTDVMAKPAMSEALSLRLSPELLEWIDRWRERQPGLAPPTRQMAIRYMLTEFLKQHEPPPPRDDE